MNAQPENTYIHHWDEKFRTRSWGRYPPEDLVRFIGRNYKNTARDQVKILEIGCGTGANLWFLHREGYAVAGIDGSPAGIEIARKRLAEENENLDTVTPDFKVGDFSSLPWADNTFDVVVDIFALYANTRAVIDQTVSEIHRVLKPGGRFYTKMWGRGCTGYGEGIKIEDGTYDEIPRGVCHDMGVSHFVDEADIHDIFKNFQIDTIDVLSRSDQGGAIKIEEYMCVMRKKDGA